MSDIYVNDIGTIFRATIKDGGVEKDISSATVMQIIFRDPDGVETTKTAVFTTDGSDGKIQYTTVSGDLDLAGKWVLQGYVETPAGKWHSSWYPFLVNENLI